MIVDQSLAARVERAEGEFVAACSRAVGERTGVPAFQLPLVGGFATYAGPGSPFNKVAGTGFDGLPTTAELDAVEARYAEQGSPVSFEISTLADPAVFAELTGRGYRLMGFEDVLLRHLDPEEADTSDAGPSGIEVARAEARVEVWKDVAAVSALTPDDAGVPWLDTFGRESLETAEQAGIDAGARAYLATIDGEPAGAGGLRVAGDIAQLTGAGTLPAFRRRGVQRALVRVRLAEALSAGCAYAVVTTQPGSTSQATVRRAGFELAYARAVLELDPRGQR